MRSSGKLQTAPRSAQSSPSETVRLMLNFFEGYARLSGFLSSKPPPTASKRGHTVALKCVRGDYQHHSS